MTVQNGQHGVAVVCDFGCGREFQARLAGYSMDPRRARRQARRRGWACNPDGKLDVCPDCHRARALSGT